MADLTDKQKAFIEHYLTCWNATEAAKKAGYSERTARSTGAENLTKPDIQEAIQARLKELQMGADEVLTRLTEQARGDIGDFVDFKKGYGVPVLKMDEAQQNGKTHLIKSFAPTRYGIKFEMYDAQAALMNIAKLRGMVVDKQEHSGPGGKPIQVETFDYNSAIAIFEAGPAGDSEAPGPSESSSDGEALG